VKKKKTEKQVKFAFFYQEQQRGFYIVDKNAKMSYIFLSDTKEKKISQFKLIPYLN